MADTLLDESMEPRHWLNLQTDYDMWVATRQTLDKIAPRIRVFQPKTV